MAPQPGDFGLTRIRGAAGVAIRAGQWLNGDGFADYEHAFLVLDRGEIIEAEPGGARIRPLADYDGTPTVYSTWTLTDAQRAALAAAGRRYEGVPYSALDYAALTARRLHIPVPGLREYIASTGHMMICSQVVDQIHLDADLHMFSDQRWPGFVTPGSLRQVLTGPQR